MKKLALIVLGIAIGSLAMTGSVLAADGMGTSGGMNQTGAMNSSGQMESTSDGMESSSRRTFSSQTDMPVNGLASWYLAPMAVYTAEDDERFSGWGAGGTLRIGKVLTDHMNLELALSGSHFYENSIQWDTFSAGLHGVYFFFRGRTFDPGIHVSPFLDLGVAFVRSRHKDTSGPGNGEYVYSNDPSFSAALGANFRLNDYGVKLRLEGGYQWTLYSGADGVDRLVFAEPQGFIGVQIPLSSQEAPPPVVKVTDHDHDSVPDNQDRCLGTPRGVVVNQSGCVLDYDKDHVPHGVDECLQTPQGTQVNAVGCTIQKEEPVKDSDGDSVPDNQDQCPNTKEDLLVMTTGCPVEATETLDEVHFALNKTEITDTGKKALRIEAEKLKTVFEKNTSAHALVIGYTDSSGPEGYNQKLSLQRAKAARSYLIGQGLPPSKLKAFGRGESNPVSTNETRTGRLENRRVVIEVLK